MIPKIIHYCWFGGNPLPESAQKCIKSWRKHFPDFEIREWNESNFDVNVLPYTQEAYQAKKYAFVSDVARLIILCNEGGLYFDTDVEVIAGFDDILERGAFMGEESGSKNGSMPLVNPGLGLASEKGNRVLESIIDYYKTLHFLNDNGEQNPGTIVTHTTYVLEKQYGLQPTNEIQFLDGITIYPEDYFNPFDDLTGILRKTNNTRSIHWFSKTWIEKPAWYFKITRIIHRIFGTSFFANLKSKICG